MMQPSSVDAERFWARVEKTDGCWLWQGATNALEYGRFSWKGRQFGAHRFAWILTSGEIPPGKYVCHHCDNPSCVRPDHLFLGWPYNNTADAIAKGRLNPARENHHLRKTTRDAVLEIRRRHALKTSTLQEMANEFRLTYEGIRQIVRRRCWKGVEPELSTTP